MVAKAMLFPREQGSGRHSREGGNPFIKLEQALIWVPASAGTTGSGNRFRREV